jgi:hypothetical protein
VPDDERRPPGDRSGGNQAVGFAALGAFLCLALVLAAVGWMGSDRPLTLAFIYVTAPPGAIFCFYRAVAEARSAAGRRPRRHDG